MGYKHPLTLMELFNWTRNSGIFWVSLLKAKEYSRRKASSFNSLEGCGNSEAVVVSAAVRLSRDSLDVMSPRNSWACLGSWSSWGAGNSNNSMCLEVSWHFGASFSSWAFEGCQSSNFWGSWPAGAFWVSGDFWSSLNSGGLWSSCGEGNGTPLQYSCLENPMDGGAWQAAVHGVAKSRTWPSDFTFTFHLHALEKEMATHFRVRAWRIPGTGEPGGLPSMGSPRVGHDWSDLAAAALPKLN